MINLKVRLKQKWFWITLIPLLFLLIDQVTQFVIAIQSITIGDMLYDSALQGLIISAIGTLFAILALIGFPVDLTTDGYGDSARALEYEKPAPNAAETGELYYIKNKTIPESGKHAKPGVEITDDDEDDDGSN